MVTGLTCKSTHQSVPTAQRSEVQEHGRGILINDSEKGLIFLKNNKKTIFDFGKGYLVMYLQLPIKSGLSENVFLASAIMKNVFQEWETILEDTLARSHYFVTTS